MTQPAPPGPLAAPPAWNLVAGGYVDENIAHLTHYAHDALRLARLAPGARVVDVACGPGTLAFAALAAGAASVAALDFSEQMLEQLRARATREGVTTIEAREGDGQALPYADHSFDVGFSMFGLIFFPDRARGLAELRRVLVPGGRAVVSSWQPIGRVPLLTGLMSALAEELPGLPSGSGKAPLSDPADFHAELGAAGFRHILVEEAVHALEWPDMKACWASVVRSFASLVLLEHKLGAAEFAPVSAGILARLTDKLGAGAQRVEFPAWLGLGTA